MVALGADALADLLLEAVKGDAARQRQVRLALSADQGPQEATAEVRKRFASIRRAQSFISWKAQRTLARELTDLIGIIETRIAPEAPNTAFEILWGLLQMAPGRQERTDDSNGTIGGIMDDAMAAIERLAPHLSVDPVGLADTVFEALLDNGYGEYDGAIPALSEALGETGLDHLKSRTEAAMDAPLSETDRARYEFVSDRDRQEDLARDGRNLTLKMILQDVADLQGDVDAWLSRYTAEQLTFHTIAPGAARRLLAADRPEDALTLVRNCLAREADKERRYDTPDLDDAHFACLEALGREQDLRAALWDRFERQLCTDALRRYLKRLPDFEDEEAFVLARDKVLSFPSLITALAFCLSWPDPALAAKLVVARSDELDGDVYEILTPTAELLAPGHPMAAVLVWRSMILLALEKARSKRYGHAARHLAACALADVNIDDYGSFPDHTSFVHALREKHGRKSAFWSRVD